MNAAVRRRLSAATGLLVFVMSQGCGDGGGTSPPEPVEAQPATGLLLDDATNHGDARDLVVEFLAPAATENVSELRVIIAKAAGAGSMTLAAAEALPGERWLAVAPQSGLQTVPLLQGLLDTDGNAIGEGTAYVAFVLSVAGGDATVNALSAPSGEVTLAVTTIKITYLRNAGVLIEDETHSVLIDALTAGLTGWIEIGSDGMGRLASGDGVFGDVDVVMGTHNHGDHFSPSAVSGFMSSVPFAQFIGPPQVRAGLSGGSRVVSVTPDRGAQETVTVNGVTIDVLHFRHFDQFGNDFSDVENYGFVVHLGGKRILHVGDVHYGVSNFEPFGLADVGIDVVILPTFNTLLSSTNADTIEEQVRAEHVLALHFQASAVAGEASQAESLFGARSLTRPLEFVRY